jgi:hypothetical protein
MTSKFACMQCYRRLCMHVVPFWISELYYRVIPPSLWISEVCFWGIPPSLFTITWLTMNAWTYDSTMHIFIRLNKRHQQHRHFIYIHRHYSSSSSFLMSLYHHRHFHHQFNIIVIFIINITSSNIYHFKETTPLHLANLHIR